MEHSTMGSVNFCFLRDLFSFMIVYYPNQSKKGQVYFSKSSR